MSSVVRDSQVRDIAVATVDVHPIVGLGLANLIDSSARMTHVGHASEGREVRRLVGEARPHVVLMDPALADVDGLELLKELRSSSRPPGIVVFSEQVGRDACSRALRAGATAYVSKRSSPEDILRGIRCGALGRRFVSTDLAVHLASLGDLDADLEPHERLSDREYEVLRRLTEGMRVSEIASSLSLSIKTVSTYRTRLLKKLELPSTAHLVKYAIEHGLAT